MSKDVLAVQEARRVEGHLEHALRAAELCSNDPVCAESLLSHKVQVNFNLS